MTDTLPTYVTRPDGTRLACRFNQGSTDRSAPLIVFLPGYMSDMTGSKAAAVADWAAAHGHAMLRFDYAGCGESGGRFAEQTLNAWRDDVLTVVDAHSNPATPVILIGSSMGGWLMLLAALALNARDGAHRVAGLIGIAAAPDFTDWGFSDVEKAIIQAEGALLEETPYSDQPYLTTRAFWESGQASRLLDGPIALSCAMHLLHGQADDDVPWQTSLILADRLHSSNVQVQLVKDGDHRLSRDADIARLIGALDLMIRSLPAL